MFTHIRGYFNLPERHSFSVLRPRREHPTAEFEVTYAICSRVLLFFRAQLLFSGYVGELRLIEYIQASCRS